MAETLSVSNIDKSNNSTSIIDRLADTSDHNDILVHNGAKRQSTKMFRHSKVSRSIFDFTVALPDGSPISLATYSGTVTVVANTASMCGFTAVQMPQLVSLQSKFGGRGDFSILAFPCAQFAMQEPKNSCDIPNWASAEYGASFPIFEKINVKGPKAHPLFLYLASTPANFGPPRWNFCKYVCDKKGIPRAKFDHSMPESLMEAKIEELLRE